MKKKLETRFPAARIKKIMQADDDVGKIALATPVLISKALELFLQDLCNQTYQITLQKGAKTMNSQHLKECVRAHSVFDFLRETVSRVPDLDAEAAGGSDTGRRRKAVEDNSGEEETKRPKLDTQQPISSGRGRGRGRGRGGGRGRGRKSTSERMAPAEHDEVDDNSMAASPQPCEYDACVPEGESSGAAKHSEAEASSGAKHTEVGTRCPKDFDLNLDLNEDGDVELVDREVEKQIESYRTGLLGQCPNVFQPEEDYDCDDED